MKRRKFLHHYRGFSIHESDCMVHIVDEEDGKHLVLFEDIDAGTSVTNSSEQLATEITSEYGLDPESCRFYETYGQYEHDAFDEIIYTWKDGKASYPHWKPASREDHMKIFFG